jgi:hypothetical protein
MLGKIADIQKSVGDDFLNVDERVGHDLFAKGRGRLSGGKQDCGKQSDQK